MVRWIAFDDDTAEIVVSRLRRGAAEIQHNSPVDAALRVEGASVIVFPSSIPGRLLLARFTPRKGGRFALADDSHISAACAPRIPVRSVSRTPSMSAPGLSSSDWMPASSASSSAHVSPLLANPSVPPAKKPWWRKIVA